MVDFPDGIVVPDHIDEDLIHSGFLQFHGCFLPDESGMANHLELRSFCLYCFNRSDEFVQRDLAILIGSAAHQNAKGTLWSEVGR